MSFRCSPFRVPGNATLGLLIVLPVDYIGERRSGIHTAVSTDVDKVFKGKSLSQLELLEDSIKKKLRGGEGVDVGESTHILL